MRNPAGRGNEVVFGKGNRESELVGSGGAGLRSRRMIGDRRRSTIHGVWLIVGSLIIMASGRLRSEGDRKRGSCDASDEYSPPRVLESAVSGNRTS